MKHAGLNLQEDDGVQAFDVNSGIAIGPSRTLIFGDTSIIFFENYYNQ